MVFDFCKVKLRSEFGNGESREWPSLSCLSILVEIDKKVDCRHILFERRDKHPKLFFGFKGRSAAFVSQEEGGI